MISLLLLVAFTVALLLVRHFQRPDSALHVLDLPNARSLHSHPVPRTGGVAVIVAFLGVWLIAPDLPPLWGTLGWLVAGTLLLAVVGLWDDFGHLAPLLRLGAHLLAALLLLFGGVVLEALPSPAPLISLSPLIAIPLTLFFIVWMINLTNFMDGMDGLAGGMGVAGFGALALFGMEAGDRAFVLLNGSVAAALLGFLAFNAPRARIFMGDAGSSVLGLLAAGFSLWGAQRGVVPLWSSLILFSPFIFDATYTLLLRLVRGERVWEAHLDHLYQRLVRAGWSHRRTLLHAYLLMALAVLAAFAAADPRAWVSWGVIGAVLLVCCALPILVGRVEARSLRR